MISKNDIKKFTDTLNKKDDATIINFLIKVGEIFRVEDPDEINPETLIRTVELIIAIHKKVIYSPDNELPENVEDVIVDCRAIALELRQKLKNKEFDKAYYKDISVMGKKIIGLASLLSLFGIVLL